MRIFMGTLVASIISSLISLSPAFSDDASDCERASGDLRLEACNRIIARGGYNAAWAYVNRGNLNYDRKDYDRALSDYTAAIRSDPKLVLAYTRRGAVYYDKKDYDNALSDYGEAIRLNPNNAFPHRNRAIVYYDKKDYDRALTDFNEAIRLEPQYAAAYVLRGRAHKSRGDSDRARADLQEALRLDSSLDTARTELANLTTSTPLATLTPATSIQVRRVALVIGNSAYRHAVLLPNPARDAASVGDALRRIGFQFVLVYNDVTRDELLEALRSFAAEASTADWAVIYFAGHGIEVGGLNYLVPIDATLRNDLDVSLEAVSLEQVLNVAKRASGLRLVLLDACRENPFASQMKRTMTVASRSVTRGLARVEPDPGTMIVYAAKEGETASDGSGGNSPFTQAFLKNITTPNLEVRRLFDTIRDDVLEATKGQQQPFTYGSISAKKDYYFVVNK